MSFYDVPYDVFDKYEVKLLEQNRDIEGLIKLLREKDGYFLTCG